MKVLKKKLGKENNLLLLLFIKVLIDKEGGEGLIEDLKELLVCEIGEGKIGKKKKMDNLFYFEKEGEGMKRG